MDEIREKILTLLDQHRIMTIATLRRLAAGAHSGLRERRTDLYFLCGPDSQSAANVVRGRSGFLDDHDTPQVMEIARLSMAARAHVVVDAAEAQKALRMLMAKYPRQGDLPLPMPAPADVRIFRVTPTVISVLD